jgi:hypothetical protein
MDSGRPAKPEAVAEAERAAAARRRVRRVLRDEVAELAGDRRDVELMRVIREQMAELAPRLTD